jgi:uncharacterized membrane protein YfcA
MIIVWYAGLILALAIVAAFASMLGIGGGVMYTPLQVIFGVDIHEAATSSLFLIMILSFSATRIYRRAGKVDWKMAMALEAFTVSGGFAGGYLSSFVPSQPLKILLIAVLILAGITMLKANQRDHSHLVDHPAWYIWTRSRNGQKYTINMLIAFPISLAAGVISGTIGIGGGILKIPMMAILLGVPIDIAIATSAFMVGITALGGFAGHLIAGHWDWKISLILTPAVFIGAWIGAHTMLKIDKRKLRITFGIFVMIIAAILVIIMM